MKIKHAAIAAILFLAGCADPLVGTWNSEEPPSTLYRTTAYDSTVTYGVDGSYELHYGYRDPDNTACWRYVTDVGSWRRDEAGNDLVAITLTRRRESDYCGTWTNTDSNPIGTSRHVAVVDGNTLTRLTPARNNPQRYTRVRQP